MGLSRLNELPRKYLMWWWGFLWESLSIKIRLNCVKILASNWCLGILHHHLYFTLTSHFLHLLGYTSLLDAHPYHLVGFDHTDHLGDAKDTPVSWFEDISPSGFLLSMSRMTTLHTHQIWYDNHNFDHTTTITTQGNGSLLHIHQILTPPFQRAFWNTSSLWHRGYRLFYNVDLPRTERDRCILHATKWFARAANIGGLASKGAAGVSKTPQRASVSSRSPKKIPAKVCEYTRIPSLFSQANSCVLPATGLYDNENPKYDGDNSGLTKLMRSAPTFLSLNPFWEELISIWQDVPSVLRVLYTFEKPTVESDWMEELGSNSKQTLLMKKFFVA